MTSVRVNSAAERTTRSRPSTTGLAPLPLCPTDHRHIDCQLPVTGSVASMELRYVGVDTASTNEAPRTISLSSLPLTLGRKSDLGTVMVTGPLHVAKGKLLSRKHTVITQRADGTIGVMDLGSVNGSYLDGVKLAARMEQVFPVGGILALGARGVVEYKLHAAEAPAKDPTTESAIEAEAEARGDAAANAEVDDGEEQQAASLQAATDDKAANMNDETACNGDEGQVGEDASVFEEATPATEDPNAADEIQRSEDMPCSQSAPASDETALRHQHKVQSPPVGHQESLEKERGELAGDEEEDPELAPVPWFWKGDKGRGIQNCWVEYSDNMSRKLEIAHQKALAALEAAAEAGQDQPAAVGAVRSRLIAAQQICCRLCHPSVLSLSTVAVLIYGFVRAHLGGSRYAWRWTNSASLSLHRRAKV